MASTEYIEGRAEGASIRNFLDCYQLQNEGKGDEVVELKFFRYRDKKPWKLMSFRDMETLLYEWMRDMTLIEVADMSKEELGLLAHWIYGDTLGRRWLTPAMVDYLKDKMTDINLFGQFETCDDFHLIKLPRAVCKILVPKMIERHYVLKGQGSKSPAALLTDNQGLGEQEKCRTEIISNLPGLMREPEIVTSEIGKLQKLEVMKLIFSQGGESSDEGYDTVRSEDQEMVDPVEL